MGAGTSAREAQATDTCVHHKRTRLGMSATHGAQVITLPANAACWLPGWPWRLEESPANSCPYHTGGGACRVQTLAHSRLIQDPVHSPMQHVLQPFYGCKLHWGVLASPARRGLHATSTKQGHTGASHSCSSAGSLSRNWQLDRTVPRNTCVQHCRAGQRGVH